ncbi:MAG: hypothetical protein MUE96_11990 [Bacteroidia bacterium]|nr:hypothetical protein [Bacteroidia bacterium]
MNTKLSQQFQKAFVLLSLILCFAVNARSQTDTEFWFAAPDVSNGGGNFDIPIAIRMATGSSAATVTISQPANSLFAPIVVSIAANSNTSVDLSTYLSSVENSPANTVNNKGLLISSTTPISAYYEVVSGFCNCNPEIFALKGTNGLGTKFYTPFQTYLNNSTAYNPTPKASFEIVATEDNTTVTITPTQNLVGGRTAGVPFIITMQKGQSYSGVADGTSAASHPTGTLIESNKPIAVSIKDDLLDGAPYGGCADLMGDQLVPVNKLGSEYVILKGQLNFGTEKAFVVATENGTTVTVNGVNVATLNAGGNYTVTFSTASVAVSASKPIYLLHMSGFGCEVGGALLPSTTCSGSDQINVVRSTNEGFFLNLLVRNGAQNNFLFNGNAGVINGASFSVVPNTSNQWVSAQISLSTSQLAVGGSARISNTTDLFQLGVIHGGAGSGTRYGYFSNFSTANVIASSNSPINAGSALNLSATAGFASYSWTGPNGFTSTSATPSISNALPINAGNYNVTVTNNIGCIGTSSTNVTVNTVPAAALNFDGSNDFVAINNPFRAFNKELTVEWWVNPSSTPQGSGIGQATAGVDNNGTSNVWLMHFWNNNNISFLVNNNGSWVGPPEVNIPLNTWSHIVGVADGNSTKLYVNGILAGTGLGVSNTIFSNPNAVMHFGKDVRFNAGRFLGGSIDEVRIWNRALCQGEIQNNWTCELPANQTGLVGYYKFNQGNAIVSNVSETNLIDASGNGRNGSLTNMALTGATSNWITPGGVTTGTTCAAFVRPTATITPAGATTFCAGGTVVLNANTGSGLTYQWQLNGNNISGATNASYTANAAGSYTVVVSQNGCTATSAAAVISILQGPVASITAPASTILCAGSAIVLNANTGSGLSITLQMQQVHIQLW